MAIPKWSRRKGWLALTVAAACALSLVFLILSSAVETGKGLWAAFFVLIIGGIGAIAGLFATEGAPLDARHWTAWLQPRPISFLFLAIFGSAGFMLDVLSIFEPRPAVESQPGAIEQGVNEIRVAVAPKATELPRIRLKLSGIWGEPGCAVTYRFAIRERALIVDSVRRPAGTPPHHLVATIVREHGDVMNITGEEPATARGKATTFTYVTNGVIERLTWDDETTPVPLELDRCG